MQNYRNKHPELIQKSTLNTNTSVTRKISQMRQSAETRGIQWSYNDEDKMKLKLLENCYYCDESVEQANGILRGLIIIKGILVII